MKGANCVLVKLSPEITLKTHFVRQYFVKKLISNIKQVFRAKKISGNQIKRGGGRLYIFPKNRENIKKIAQALKSVFGVQAVAECRRIPSNKKEEIVKEAVSLAIEIIKPNDSFAVRVKRVGEKTFSTKEIESEIGSKILKKIEKIKVNLEKPEKKLSIEVKRGESFFYCAQEQGVTGLPLGVEGNVAMFFYGKKSETLAAFLMMKRGCNIFPVLEKKTKKLQSHVNKLKKWNSFRAFKFSVKRDLKELIEKKDISIKAIVFADKKFSAKFEEQKKKSSVAVFWPLVFFSKKLEQNLEAILK